MSETVYTQLGETLAQSIQPELTDLYALAERDSISAFINAVAPENPLAVDQQDDYFLPDLDGLSAHDKAAFVDFVLCLVDETATFIQSLSVRDAKKQKNTEVEPEMQKWQAAVRWLKRGSDSILKNGIATSPEDASDREMSLPLALTLLTFEAVNALNETDDDRDKMRNEILSGIQQNQKNNFDKSGDPRIQTIMLAANMLTDYYHRANTTDFVSRFMRQQTYAIDKVYKTDEQALKQLERSNTVTGAWAAAYNDNDVTADELHTMAEPLGIADRDYLKLILNSQMQFVSRFGFKLPKSTKKRELFAINPALASSDPDYLAKFIKHREVYEDETLKRRPEFLKESHRIISTRAIVDGLMNGTLDFTDAQALHALAQSKPLTVRKKLVSEPDQVVDWEIVPPGTQNDIAEGTGMPRERAPVFVDEERVEYLRGYIRLWGEGRIVRSRIPNLPEDKQYYLAILPQTVGGVLLEHAIGDNKESEHAVFMWRAEKGLGRFGQPQRTWDSVYRVDKNAMRQMGAKRILHTANLGNKIVEYLTRPVDMLEEKRYFFK